MHTIKASAIAILASLSLPLLSSCGLPNALGRSFSRLIDYQSTTHPSGNTPVPMFESLREIDRELQADGFTRPEEDSTR